MKALRQMSKSNAVPALALEAESSKGYIDGFTTAKAFASHNSKLGFTGQYMMDMIAKAGQVPGTEKDYKEEFMRGLIAGENMVQSAVVS